MLRPARMCESVRDESKASRTRVPATLRSRFHSHGERSSASGARATFLLLSFRREPISPVVKTSQLLEFGYYPPKVERIKCTEGRGRADRVSARPCSFKQAASESTRWDVPRYL